MKPILMSHWRAAVGSNNRASATKPQHADTRGSIVPWDLSGDAAAVAVADTTRDLDATTPCCWVCIPNTTAPTIRDAAVVAGHCPRHDADAHADAQDHAHADSTHPSEPERAIAIDTVTECCGLPPLREFVN